MSFNSPDDGLYPISPPLRTTSTHSRNNSIIKKAKISFNQYTATTRSNEKATDPTRDEEQGLLAKKVAWISSKITEVDQAKIALHSLQSRVANLEFRSKSMHSGTSFPSSSFSGADDKTKKLAQDTFSFMVFAPLRSIPFLLAFTVFGLQVLTFTLVAINIIDPSNSINPLGIPANVEFSVRITQLIAILVAVATQEDIRTALMLLHQGYKNNTLEAAFQDKDGDGASLRKWLLSITCRFLEGALGLTVTFILIMTAETVIDLLLNFTAMEFVSHLDDLAFLLARQGYLGNRNKAAANKALYTSYVIQQKFGMRAHPILLLLIIFGGLLAGWGVIVHHQQSGRYLCETVFVQFGDTFLPALGTFSGLYDRVKAGRKGLRPRRVTYVERQSGRAMFGYCNDQKAWTFTYDWGRYDMDPCNWRARSAATKTFDLTTTTSSGWFVKNNEHRVIPLHPFHLACYDCHKTDDVCGSRGFCTNAVCSCGEGFYGLRCEFREPCLSMETDSRFDGFLGTREWSSRYGKLESQNQTTEAYHRPVYVSEYQPGLFDIILFTGRRWVLTNSDLLPVESDVSQSPRDALSEYLIQDFHGHWSEYSVAFISEPMDFDTASEAETPIGLVWFNAKARQREAQLGIQSVDSNRASSTLLICSVCDDVRNPCLYDATCVEGSCKCSEGSSGTLCQIPPIRNGRCDPFFNTPEFGFDGGDCCKSTCVSSTEHTCGKDSSGYADSGFFFCHQPANAWVANGGPMQGDIYSRAGFSVALSGNGAALAVGEPGVSTVRLFDQDGSEWIQRGRALEAPMNVEFGTSIAMSDDSVGTVNNPLTAAPVFLAVGGPSVDDDGFGMARVYNCVTQGCNQIGADLPVLGGSIADKSFGSSIDLSSNGTVVVVGAPDFAADDGGYARVYELQDNSWIPRGDVFQDDTNETFKKTIGFSTSLSGHGNVLAFGSAKLFIEGVPGSAWAEGVLSVEAFEWDGDTWAPKGSPIQQTIERTEIPEEFSLAFGHQSIVLSEDGNTLAIGVLWYESPLEDGVRVFFWDGSNWIQRGSTVGVSDEQKVVSGWSVALSADGSTVSVGIGNGDGSSAGIGTFSWNGTEWEQLGNQVSGGVKSSVALSSDGSVLAGGLPFATLNEKGITSVHAYSSAGCENGTSLLRFSLTTDEYPEDTTWDIVDNATGNVLMEGGPYGDIFGNDRRSLTTFVEEICVATDGCAIFTIYDKIGLYYVQSGESSDGIEPPGRYDLFLDGMEVAGGTLTDSFDRIFVGNCHACAIGSKLFRLLIMTKVPVTWELVDDSGSLLLEGATVSEIEDEARAWDEVCISSDECATLTLRFHGDKGGRRLAWSQVDVDYVIYLDDELVAEGGAAGPGLEHPNVISVCPPQT